MNRETIKVEFDNRQYEFYTKPTILEEQKIRNSAAEFTGGGIEKLIELESLRNMHLDKCLIKDENGKAVKGDDEESVKVDVNSWDFKMYAEHQRILDNAYFYGLLKISLANGPDGFDADNLEGIKFYGLKSAFEDALDSFREQGRNTEAGKSSEGNSHPAEPPAK
jgi:hypothetical protein